MCSENTLLIRRGTLDDAPAVLDLYKKVSYKYPNNLMQESDELTLPYIQQTLRLASERGLVLLIFEQEKLIGYMKGYTSEYRRHAHVLNNVTAMIDPTVVNHGYVSKLWQAYTNEIYKSFRHIRLIEILVTDSNVDTIGIYKRKGFVIKAYLHEKARYNDGTFGAGIILNWTNPNFCEQSLSQYHNYLAKLIKIQNNPDQNSLTNNR